MIENYFRYGDGRTILSKAVTGALEDIMPKLFSKKDEKPT